jgi:hypothetical protein
MLGASSPLSAKVGLNQNLPLGTNIICRGAVVPVLAHPSFVVSAHFTEGINLQKKKSRRRSQHSSDRVLFTI